MPGLVLFGVGQHTDKFIGIIDYFGGKVSCLTDNDEQKAGTIYNGLEIIPPQALVDMDCRIIISCIHGREIVRQLAEMKIGNKLVPLKDYLDELSAREAGTPKTAVRTSEGSAVYLDLFSGVRWGGAENWNMVLAVAFARRRAGIGMIADDTVDIPPDSLCDVQVRLKRFGVMGAIREVAEYLGGERPFVFVNSFFGESFFAVLAMKQLYPKDVRIISVIHSDQSSQYALGVLFADFTDRYLCVSNKIRDTLINEYRIPPERAVFLYQPVMSSGYSGRRIDSRGPLRLGIASRLVEKQKRCGLIPQFIGFLEEAGVDYLLDIAGDGELLDMLRDYISDRGLSCRVRLLGHLDGGQMAVFWERHDVYINISEFEGTSLSMLEAMKAGCVPLVTDVSGARDYITDGYNGFIFDVNDLAGMAAKVRMLGRNRALLSDLGKNAEKAVLYKCDINKYVDNFLEMMDL